jgi:hypothetical protein
VLKPYFNAQDIAGLPNWHLYARLQINNERVTPFSFKTQLLKTPFNGKIAALIKAHSREAYGQNCADVDRRIMERRIEWRNDHL